MSLLKEKYKGKNHQKWKGGKTYNRGYVLLYLPTHPYCNVNGYIREHRLIIEKHLRRYLKKNEIVHHINGKRDDNRLENLLLLKTSDHNRLNILIECPRCNHRFNPRSLLDN